MKKGTTDYPQLLNFGWLWWHYWVYHYIPTRTYSESETGHLNYLYNNGDRIRGENNPFFGKHHTEDTKQKLSGQRKNKHCGENNHFFGKHHTEETKTLISDHHIEFYKNHPEAIGEMSRRMKEYYITYPEKAIEARNHLMKQVVPSHHTKPELVFMDICKQNSIDFHFVGDRSLWIGNKVKLNPDFIEANGQKILVEIMGDYWHSPLLNPKVDKIRTLPYRKKHFKKYGWIPIFIWESDMRRSDAEQFVLKTLSEHIKVR